MDKKIVSEIAKYKKEMKELGYNLKDIVLVLNENMFKKNRFELLGFSIVYDDINTPYCFREFKRGGYKWVNSKR